LGAEVAEDGTPDRFLEVVRGGFPAFSRSVDDGFHDGKCIGRCDVHAPLGWQVRPHQYLRQQGAQFIRGALCLRVQRETALLEIQQSSQGGAAKLVPYGRDNEFGQSQTP
jgi:hypothetical protein